MDNTKCGYVYVLQMEGHDYYKIGRTVNMTRRIAEISPQMPGRLRLVFAFKVKDAWRTESILHNDFRAVRMNGEWFRLTSENLLQIRSMLLLDQSFALSERLLRRLNHDAFDSSVSLGDVSRIALLVSRAALRAERRVDQYLAFSPAYTPISDEVLDAEVVL